MKKQLEMIQSNNQENTELTNELLKDLLLNQKMTHFQLIEALRYDKPITLQEVSQLYSFLGSIGYTKISTSVVELINMIKELKVEYDFSYIDEPHSVNNPEDTILYIYYEQSGVLNEKSA